MFYAFGFNQYNINNSACSTCSDSLHAEVDCVRRLRKAKKKQVINICVFRTNNKGDSLMMAKPCENCINSINTILRQKNYRLKKLLYTNEKGEVEKY